VAAKAVSSPYHKIQNRRGMRLDIAEVMSECRQYISRQYFYKRDPNISLEYSELNSYSRSLIDSVKAHRKRRSKPEKKSGLGERVSKGEEKKNLKPSGDAKAQVSSEQLVIESPVLVSDGGNSAGSENGFQDQEVLGSSSWWEKVKHFFGMLWGGIALIILVSMLYSCGYEFVDALKRNL